MGKRSVCTDAGPPRGSKRALENSSSEQDRNNVVLSYAIVDTDFWQGGVLEKYYDGHSYSITG